MKHQNAESRKKAMLSYSAWLTAAALLLFGMGYAANSIDQTELQQYRMEEGNAVPQINFDTKDLIEQLSELEADISTEYGKREDGKTIVVAGKIREGLKIEEGASEETRTAMGKVNAILDRLESTMDYNQNMTLALSQEKKDLQRRLDECEDKLKALQSQTGVYN